MGGAQAVGATALGDVGRIVHQGIKGHQQAVRPVVRGKRVAVGHFPVAVTDIDGGVAVFKMIAEDNMVVAEDADARRIDEIVAVYHAVIAMAQRKLRGAVADGIVAHGNGGSLDGYQLVFTGALFKYVVLHGAVARRKAVAAEAELEGLRAIARLRQEIKKVVMVNPQPLGYLAAGAAHGNKTAQRVFVLESVIVHLVIVSIEQQVFAVTGALKQVLRPAAEAGARGHGGLRGVAGELKPLDNDIGGGAYDADAGGTAYLRPSYRLAGDGDGLRNRTLPADGNIGRGGVHAVGQHDHIAGRGAVNSGLQGRQGGYVNGSGGKGARQQQAKDCKQEAGFFQHGGKGAPGRGSVVVLHVASFNG